MCILLIEISSTFKIKYLTLESTVNYITKVEGIRNNYNMFLNLQWLK